MSRKLDYVVVAAIVVVVTAFAAAANVFVYVFVVFVLVVVVVVLVVEVTLNVVGGVILLFLLLDGAGNTWQCYTHLKYKSYCTIFKLINKPSKIILERVAWNASSSS